MISLIKFREIGEKYGLIYVHKDLYFDKIDLKNWVAYWDSKQGVTIWNKIYIKDNDIQTNDVYSFIVTKITEFEKEMRKFNKNLKIARMKVRLKQIKKDFE